MPANFGSYAYPRQKFPAPHFEPEIASRPPRITGKFLCVTNLTAWLQQACAACVCATPQSGANCLRISDGLDPAVQHWPWLQTMSLVGLERSLLSKARPGCGTWLYGKVLRYLRTCPRACVGSCATSSLHECSVRNYREPIPRRIPQLLLSTLVAHSRSFLKQHGLRPASGCPLRQAAG